MIVVICAFLAGVAYAIYLYKTDSDLEMFVFVLPLIPFLFAVPNLILSLIVFAFIRRPSYFVPTLVILCLIACATPWIYAKGTEYWSNTNYQKQLNLELQEAQTRTQISQCQNYYSWEPWVACVDATVKTELDYQTCLTQTQAYAKCVNCNVAQACQTAKAGNASGAN